MPELPEVEHLRRSLEPVMVGHTITGFAIHRSDVVRDERSERSTPGSMRRALIGSTVTSLIRRGKQLAIVTDRGAVLCVHLGMSGQLLFIPHLQRMVRSDHVHCTWHLENGKPGGRIAFRDPRRFGGVWLFESLEAMIERRWIGLGPDALDVTSAALRRSLGSSRRAIKAALLDQAAIAGVGNIYADETLYRARIHPLTEARSLAGNQWANLAAAIRQVMRDAVRSGGSTVRDYQDGLGRKGEYSNQHQVYGRAGERCYRCRTMLSHVRIAQRSSVFCPNCQHR